jgi:hypothetical protein
VRVYPRALEVVGSCEAGGGVRPAGVFGKRDGRRKPIRGSREHPRSRPIGGIFRDRIEELLVELGDVLPPRVPAARHIEALNAVC